MKHVLLPHDNPQLHWALHSECSTRTLSAVTQKEEKNPTQADMIRVLSWLRAYTMQTITLITSMLYVQNLRLFVSVKMSI